eukprot:4772553-Prymnesium_polylepis.1
MARVCRSGGFFNRSSAVMENRDPQAPRTVQRGLKPQRGSAHAQKLLDDAMRDIVTRDTKPTAKQAESWLPFKPGSRPPCYPSQEHLPMARVCPRTVRML